MSFESELSSQYEYYRSKNEDYDMKEIARLKKENKSLQQENEQLKSDVKMYQNQQGTHEELIIQHTKTIHRQLQELGSLQKCYKVTSESWKNLAEENQQLKSTLRQAYVALNRAEWLMAGTQIDEESGKKISAAIKAIEGVLR